MNMLDKPNRPVPKRLAILLALKSLLEGVSEADGDAFTLAGKVYLNRSLLGADVNEMPNLPAVAIIESPRSDIAGYAGPESEMRRDNWSILVQGISADSRRVEKSNDVYYLCQDVERRLHRMQAEKPGSGRPLYPEHHMLGGMIASAEIVPPIIRPPENGVANNSFFYIVIRFSVAMEIGD